MPSSSLLVTTLLAVGCLLAAQEPPPTAPRSRIPDDATRRGSPPNGGATAYADLQAKVETWQKDHRNLVRRVELGTSVGGRPLYVLRIGAANEGAPEVYLGAGIHGNEGAELDLVAIVDHLLTHSQREDIATLLRSRVLWVQPAVNPDGLAAAERANARRVDLNRNFAIRWQAGYRHPSRYPGAVAFSEPETRAVRDFLRRRPHLRAYLDLHRSIAKLVPARGLPGTDDAAMQRASATLLALLPERPSFFAQQNAATEGSDATRSDPWSGLSVDWVWGELGVVAFTLENLRDEAFAGEDDPRWRCFVHLLEQAPNYPASRVTASEPHAELVTAATLADPAELARLQRPGTVLFADGFESDASLRSYFEIGGQAEGRVQIARAPENVHTGGSSLELVSTANDGKASGAGPVLWLGDAGHDCVHLRYWLRYAPDYDQGNLHHTGGSLAGVAGIDKWRGMGGAGLRPAGDDHFSTRVEGWRNWQRVPAPGFLHCYTYWMDMRRDGDGKFWGNMLGPHEAERVVPKRGEWHCVELRVAANAPGVANGELAVWLDGRLYVHYQGIRWRSDESVRIKRASLSVYVHEARRDNRVWFDDVLVATGYIGPERAVAR